MNSRLRNGRIVRLQIPKKNVPVHTYITTLFTKEPPFSQHINHHSNNQTRKNETLSGQKSLSELSLDDLLKMHLHHDLETPPPGIDRFSEKKSKAKYDIGYNPIILRSFADEHGIQAALDQIPSKYPIFRLENSNSNSGTEKSSRIKNQRYLDQPSGKNKEYEFPAVFEPEAMGEELKLKFNSPHYPSIFPAPAFTLPYSLLFQQQDKAEEVKPVLLTYVRFLTFNSPNSRKYAPRLEIIGYTNNSTVRHFGSPKTRQKLFDSYEHVIQNVFDQEQNLQMKEEPFCALSISLDHPELFLKLGTPAHKSSQYLFYADSDSLEAISDQNDQKEKKERKHRGERNHQNQNSDADVDANNGFKTTNIRSRNRSSDAASSGANSGSLSASVSHSTSTQNLSSNPQNLTSNPQNLQPNLQNLSSNLPSNPQNLQQNLQNLQSKAKFIKRPQALAFACAVGRPITIYPHHKYNGKLVAEQNKLLFKMLSEAQRILNRGANSEILTIDNSSEIFGISRLYPFLWPEAKRLEDYLSSHDGMLLILPMYSSVGAKMKLREQNVYQMLLNWFKCFEMRQKAENRYACEMIGCDYEADKVNVVGLKSRVKCIVEKSTLYA